MQVYDRSLSGLGMKLSFSRIVNGKLIRSVKGQLTKFFTIVVQVGVPAEI